MRAFTAQAVIFILIAVLYFYFGFHERYLFTIWWWDIPLHILGGLWVALAGTWFFGLFGIRVRPMQAIALAFSVGVAWELFEYLFGIGGSLFMSYPVDTAKDLFDDVLGGAVGALLLGYL
ncbi:MAG TPA: hypothetical protein VMH91_01595 [Candidatus Paceibacterota bacterium]|nr:hypothetical protein [Candidatus Paceibacterota bacterium]